MGDLFTQRGVFGEVTKVTRHRFGVSGLGLFEFSDFGTQAHHGLIGLELGEAGFQNLACSGAAHLADQVDGHVVTGLEGRAQWIRTCGGQAGENLRVEFVRPHHYRVALDVDAAAPCPSGELGVFPGGEVHVRLTIPLHQPLEDHRTRGHVDAQCQGLGSENHLDQSALEQVLDDLLERREHAGVVRGDAALEGIGPVHVAEGGEVFVGDGHGPGRDDRSNGFAFTAGGEPQTCAQALLHSIITTCAREQEVDARQEVLGIEFLHHLAAPRGERITVPATASSSVSTAAAWRSTVMTAPRESKEFGVDGVLIDEQVVQMVSRNHVLPQRHRTMFLNDDLGLAAHR